MPEKLLPSKHPAGIFDEYRQDDIDLSAYSIGTGWIPIGTNSNAFCGTFDGNGRTIRNLYIFDTGLDNAGLFGCARDGSVIRNIKLEDVNIQANNCVGGLVGYSTGSIDSCYVSGTVEGVVNVGGIAGVCQELTNSASAVNVSGNEYVGGLTGLVQWEAVFYACWSTGEVRGNFYVGGLFGACDIDLDIEIDSCMALNSIVSAVGNVGRLYGSHQGSADISDSYAFDGMEDGSGNPFIPKGAGGADEPPTS